MKRLHRLMAELSLDERIDLGLVVPRESHARVVGRLKVTQCPLETANEWVLTYHRHNRPVISHKCSLKAYDDRTGETKGVAILGRPLSRHLDDGQTLEVTRLVTAGAPHVCSKLYAAARRVAHRHGYARVITYTRADEPGTSLRAAGWTRVGITRARPWNCPARQRRENDLIDKLRWHAPAPTKRLPGITPFATVNATTQHQITFDMQTVRFLESLPGSPPAPDPAERRLCDLLEQYLHARDAA